MSAPLNPSPAAQESAADLTATLRTAVVLRVREDDCDLIGGPTGPGRPSGGRAAEFGARFAPAMPTPRRERISPGHLVAVTTGDDGSPVVLWRWFDVVVLGSTAGEQEAIESRTAAVWEPGHGELIATYRPSCGALAAGTRAYASAGLPGADWWIAAAVPDQPATASPDVELLEVAQLYQAYELWADSLAAPH